MSGSATDWDAWVGNPDSTTPGASMGAAANPILARMALNQAKDASAPGGGAAPTAIQTGADASSGQAPAAPQPQPQPQAPPQAQGSAIDPAVLARIKAATILAQQQPAAPPPQQPSGPVSGPRAGGPAPAPPAAPQTPPGPPPGAPQGVPPGGPPAPAVPPRPSQATNPAVLANIAGQMKAGVAANPAASMSSPYTGQDVYSIIAPGESGGNPNAKATGSSASGPAQFTDGTWAAYKAANPGIPDSDRNTVSGAKQATNWLAMNNGKVLGQGGQPPTLGQVVSAHMIGAGGVSTLLAHPNDPISATLPSSFVTNNPGVLKPGMTGAEALAAIPNYYLGKGGALSSAPASASSTTDAQGTPEDPSRAPLTAALLGALGRSQKWAQDNPMGMPVGQQMLALAGGLLKGRSFTNALGQGFSALADSQEKGAANIMKNNTDTAQLASLGLKDVTQQQNLLNAMHRTSIAEDNSKRQQSIADWRMSPDGQAANQQAVAQGKALSTATVKDNMTDSQEIDDAGMSAMKNIPALQGLKASLATAGSGPSYANTTARWLATKMGISLDGTDSDSVQLSKALSSMGQASAATSMKGLGLRTQNEFNTFIGGAANLNNSPEVANKLIDMVQARAQTDAQMYSDWHSMAPSDRASRMTTTGGVSDWRAPYLEATAAKQGVSVNSGSNASAPTAPAAAGSTVVLRGPPTAKNPSGIFQVPEGPMADQYRAHGYQ